MTIFRRILFFVFAAGFLEFVFLGKISYHNIELRDLLVKINLALLLGLQIWSIVFLKVEPTLTRIGMVAIIFWVTGLLFANAFTGIIP
jgi:uncharacterized membrane protein